MSISIEGANVSDFLVPTSPAEEFRVGQAVNLSRQRSGIIKYVGQVHFTDGILYGIELTDGSGGKHDGTAYGVKYFDGRPKRCIFVNKEGIVDASSTFSDVPSSAVAKKYKSSRRVNTRARAESTPMRSQSARAIPQSIVTTKRTNLPSKSRPAQRAKKTSTSTRVLPSTSRSFNQPTRKRAQSSRTIPRPHVPATRSNASIRASTQSYSDSPLLADKPMHPLSRHAASRMNEEPETSSRRADRKLGPREIGRTKGWRGYVDEDENSFGNTNSPHSQSLSSLRSPRSSGNKSRSPQKLASKSMTTLREDRPEPRKTPQKTPRDDDNDVEAEERSDNASGNESDHDPNPNALKTWMKTESLWQPELYECLTEMEIDDPGYLSVFAFSEINALVDDATKRVEQRGPRAVTKAAPIFSSFKTAHAKLMGGS